MNRAVIGVNHPDPTGKARVQIEEYGQRGLGGTRGAASGVVTHEGDKRFVTRAEARRLVELGTHHYCKDLHGRVIEEAVIVEKKERTGEEEV